jgi:hypothetical protein
VSELDHLRAAIAEADRHYQPPPDPAPGVDRWKHLRDTCPHGIVRGLITCPVCEPEKQAAAEASDRAAVVERPDEGGEYRCSNCGTRGWDCLYAMNCSLTERRCCRECGINQTHSRPGAFEAAEMSSDGE